MYVCVSMLVSVWMGITKSTITLSRYDTCQFVYFEAVRVRVCVYVSVSLAGPQYNSMAAHVLRPSQSQRALCQGN